MATAAGASAESELLQQLYRENNELRSKINSLQREVYNKNSQIESLEDELRSLRQSKDQRETTPIQNAGRGRRVSVAKKSEANNGGALQKDLDDTRLNLVKKSQENKQLREDNANLHLSLEKQRAEREQLERDFSELETEMENLKRQQSKMEKESKMREAKREKVVENVEQPRDESQISRKLEEAEETIEKLKKQVISSATDANARHNEQQNQIQGFEALIEEIKKEYDEFLEVTKLENDSFRSSLQAEYDRLREEFENYRLQQFEEKRKLVLESQGLLYQMQTQFDEYRTTAEFLFNAEVAKLEDELTSQAMRYSQEIMYIVQAKDKFYEDMTVAKDAKIMSLIEGSDLQSMLQKHELDMENLRKEHLKEIERIKSEQESEQKNLILLLQRENASLESKCEKLQLHIKALEARIKDLLFTIEHKNRQISDKEEQRLKLEQEYQRKLDEANQRNNKLLQEKEHLRHKVIRMRLDAKGEGDNSIENMIKRITRDTIDLSSEYEDLAAKYDMVSSEYSATLKKLREREKFAQFLEKEIEKRNDEIQKLTSTFETFLISRSKQLARESSLTAKKEVKKEEPMRDNWIDGPQVIGPSGRARPLQFSVQPNVKIQIPDMMKDDIKQEVDSKVELERGQAYLRRFKHLTRAFATGDFRHVQSIPAADSTNHANESLWQHHKINLYDRLDETSVMKAKLYGSSVGEDDLIQATSKSAIYKPTKREEIKAVDRQKADAIRVYDFKGQLAAAPTKSKKKDKNKEKGRESSNIILTANAGGSSPSPLVADG